MPSFTEFVYLQGKLKWTRTKQVNPWGKWTTTIYPVPADLEKIRELQAEGLKNIIKKDEDGYHVSFNRPSEKKDRTGRMYGLVPVEVINKDGSVYEGLIGNGTDATIKLEVYEHKTPSGKAKAARLMSIRIDNLVPFIPKEDFDEAQQRLVKGLADQPPQPNF